MPTQIDVKQTSRIKQSAKQPPPPKERTKKVDFPLRSERWGKALLTSMRPYQWVKNILVFAALFFSLSFLKVPAIFATLLAFASFCLAGSGIYLLNDLRDRAADRLHPLKKLRPIAAGQLPVRIAAVASIVLLLAGLGVGASVNLDLFLVLLVYILMNIGYSLGLKKLVLVDVMVVAIGFLLRAVAGAFAIGVAVSPWLFICTLLLALLLVFGKRRSELALLGTHANDHRRSLEHYNLPFLDGLMFTSAGAAIVTYCLYTMAEDVVRRFETTWLIATTPMAIYGIFRYLYLIYVKKEGGDPTRMIIRDKAFLVNGLIWLLTVVFILYCTKLR
jgi:4-hydroxybenzoate polyprenyltransferase